MVQASNPPHTRDDAAKLLSYNPETGALTWIVNRGGGARAGDPAGHRRGDDGYVTVHLWHRQVAVHRLAWLYVHGEWPDGMIDHINGIRHDNRIANLRIGDASGNAQNQRKARADNRSGFLGVHYKSDRRQWAAQITLGGRRRHLGYFTCPDEAHAAYLDAKRRLHEFCTI